MNSDRVTICSEYRYTRYVTSRPELPYVWPAWKGASRISIYIHLFKLGHGSSLPNLLEVKLILSSFRVIIPQASEGIGPSLKGDSWRALNNLFNFEECGVSFIVFFTFWFLFLCFPLSVVSSISKVKMRWGRGDQTALFSLFSLTEENAQNKNVVSE